MSLQSLKNQLFLSMQTNGRPTTGQLHECVFGLPLFYLFIFFLQSPAGKTSVLVKWKMRERSQTFINEIKSFTFCRVS